MKSLPEHNAHPWFSTYRIIGLGLALFILALSNQGYTQSPSHKKTTFSDTPVSHHTVRYHPRTVTAPFQEQLSPLVDQALQALPPKMKLALKPFELSFVPTERLGRFTFAALSPFSDRILLNSLWKEVLLSPQERQMPPSVWGPLYLKKLKYKDDPQNPTLWPRHPSMERFLVATLIHEMGHLYDELRLPNAERPRSRPRCNSASATKNRTLRHGCDPAGRNPRTVSEQPEFRTLAGYPLRGLILAGHPDKNINDSPYGRLDAYERENAQESFAVNLEFFLTDPDYQCQRPLLYEYLVRHFDWTPFAPKSCEPLETVLLSSDYANDLSEVIEPWDYQRLYRMDYLWAGPGPDWGSEFGHAMLRLVFCDPRRKELNEECLKDISHHRVVTFRANIFDLNMDSIAALKGEYPSLLNIATLSETKILYNRIELRDLFALPLRLTEHQKKRLYTLILQMHWSYQSRYKFLSNNCTHETLTLINSALFDIPQFHDFYTSRPDILYEKLLTNGLGNGYPYKRLQRMPYTTFSPTIDQALYYPSVRGKIEKHLEALKKSGFFKNIETVEAYAEQPVSIREHAFEQIRDEFQKHPNEDLEKLLFSLLGIETFCLERTKFKILKTLQPKILMDHPEKVAEILNPVDADGKRQGAYFDLIAQLATPAGALRLTEGYGVPQKSERQVFQPTQSSQIFKQNKEKLKELMDWAETQLPAPIRHSKNRQEELIKQLGPLLKKHSFIIQNTPP